MCCAAAWCRSVSSLLLAACLVACRAPGTIRPTVKIGLVAPFEGRYRYVGYDALYAVRLAVREVNASGGVRGYGIELVAYNDNADPAMAVEQARKLAVDPQVIAVIGHLREETTRAAVPVYGEAGIPLVALAALDSALGRDEAVTYVLGADGERLAGALLDRLGSQDRAALITAGGPLGEALVAESERRRMRALLAFSLSDATWLSDVLTSGVEAIVCDADPVTAGEAAAALRAAGWNGVLMGGPDLAAGDFVAVAGESAWGALVVSPYPFPGDVPEGADFIPRYLALSPHAPQPGLLAMPAYEGAYLLFEVIEETIAVCGQPTRERVAAVLAQREPSDEPVYWYRVGVTGVPERVGE